MEGLEGVIFKKPVDPDRLREKLCEVLAAKRARSLEVRRKEADR
jgi:hypothetical protein